MKKHHSLWLKNAEHYENPLDADFECDVAIVGAGISGISAAYHLSEKGFRVAVFEKDVAGSGSTGYSGGFLAASAIFDLNQMIERWGEEKGTLVYRAIIDSIALIEKIIRDKKIDCDFEKNGALCIGAKPSHFSYLEDEFEYLEELGTRAELLEPGDPRIPIKQVYGALKTFGDASINPFKFVQEICKLLITKGVNIFTHTKIVSIKNDSSGIILKDEKGHTINSKYVILASNGFSISGKKDPSTIEHTSHIAITKPIHGIRRILKGELIWNTDEVYNYLRLLDDDRILIGGEDSWLGKVTHKHTREKSVKKRDDKLLKKLRIFFPDFPIEIETSWIGTLTCPLDGLASIKEDGRQFSIITECIPFGWLLGKIAMEKITGVDSEYAKLFAYKRNYGLLQNIIIHMPIPQKLKDLILKIGFAILRTIQP